MTRKNIAVCFELAYVVDMPMANELLDSQKITFLNKFHPGSLFGMLTI